MSGRGQAIARWGVAAGAALAMALGLPAPAGAFASKGVAVVTAVLGHVSVVHPSDVASREARPPTEPLRFRDGIFLGDVIATERQSGAKLLVRGRASVAIRGPSRVEVREGTAPADSRHTRSVVNLLAGAVRAIVQRELRPQDELQIETPNTLAALQGADVVVEIYRDTPPPALPPGAELKPSTQPARFEVAQGLLGIVTRYYVISGRIEVQGLTAGALQGIEKVGDLPPRVFSFLPEASPQVLAGFPATVSTGPLGAHYERILAGLSAQAAGAAGVFRVGAPVLPIEREIDTLTAALHRDFIVTGSVSGTLTVSPTGQLQLTNVTFHPLNGLGLSAVSFVGVLAPPPGLLGTGRLLSGTVTGSARLFDATPGGVSVSIVGNIGLDFLILSGRGGLALLGTRLNGPLSGRYVCVGGFACLPPTLGGVSGSFR